VLLLVYRGGVACSAVYTVKHHVPKTQLSCSASDLKHSQLLPLVHSAGGEMTDLDEDQVDLHGIYNGDDMKRKFDCTHSPRLL
jgi:hypothetical protein